MPTKGNRHRSPRTDTMKCVRMTYAPCAMKRISTEEADKLVKGGMAVYVSKKDWKAAEQKKAA